MRDVDEGRFYLPDAEEGKRETLVTSSIDAEPMQCLRVPGPTLPADARRRVHRRRLHLPDLPRCTRPRSISGALALGAILAGSGPAPRSIPEKPEKDVGLGLRLPLYASGPRSVGWWAMFITMLGDVTAFLSLVFGYFFFWTVHADFPPEAAPGPGPALAAARPGAAARGVAADPAGARLEQARARSGDAGIARWRPRRSPALGGAALLAGPWLTGLDPTAHVYPAIVWVLVIWTALHVGAGIIMQLYCLARSLAGRLTPAARHRHLQRHALLALRGGDRARHGGGGGPVPDGGVMAERAHPAGCRRAGREPVGDDRRADHLGGAFPGLLHPGRDLLRQGRSARRPTSRTVRWWIAGLTVVALAAIAACAIQAFRRGHFMEGKAAPHDADTHPRPAALSRLCDPAAERAQLRRDRVRGPARRLLRELPVMRPLLATSGCLVLAAGLAGPAGARHRRTGFAGHMASTSRWSRSPHRCSRSGSPARASIRRRLHPLLFAPLLAMALEFVVVWGWHAPVLHAAARASQAVHGGSSRPRSSQSASWSGSRPSAAAAARRVPPGERASSPCFSPRCT